MEVGVGGEYDPTNVIRYKYNHTLLYRYDYMVQIVSLISTDDLRMHNQLDLCVMYGPLILLFIGD